MSFIRKSIPLGLFVVLTAMGYLWFIVDIQRHQHSVLLLNWGLLSCCYLWHPRMSLRQVALIGLLFRVLFLFYTPALSQDFYRFLWDGQLQLLGHSPYALTPDDWMAAGLEFTDIELLHAGMGTLSAGHFSNYPPLSQMLFFAVVRLADGWQGQLILLRGLLIVADLFLLLGGARLLRSLQLKPEWMSWYFLNPMVIIELIGNLHFEGMMWCFFVWGVYFSFRYKQLLPMALAFVASIASKLLPLLVLPLYWQRLGPRRSLYFALLGIAGCTALSFPYWVNEGAAHYLQTLQLWFNRFEFNGSFYRLLRWIGYQFYGYNPIRSIGKFSPFLILGLVAGISFFGENKTPKSLLRNMLWVLSLYFLSSTTVHPWYVSGLLLLGVFSGYGFPVVWSLSVYLSYLAYGPEQVHESPWILLLEYAPVYALLWYECWKGPVGPQIMWRRSTSLVVK
ncbi:MAG: mannosyltransferase [Flavobacteriaceae bacterium]